MCEIGIFCQQQIDADIRIFPFVGQEIALASIQRYQIINKIETTKCTIRNTHL